LRNSDAIVTELREKAASYAFLALVVGFSEHSEFVFDFDKEPIQKLDEMIERGGIPLGFIGMRRIDEGQMSCRLYILPEWKGDNDVETVLQQIKHRAVRQLQKFATGFSYQGLLSLN